MTAKQDARPNVKVALITGITGQDGAYLAEFLLKKGYVVYGVKRWSSSPNMQRVDHIGVDYDGIESGLRIRHGDMTDSSNVLRLVNEIQPDEIYNLAAMSHVHVSFGTPESTSDIDGLGLLRLLEAVRILGLERKTRIYQASTSELFGKVRTVPQTEDTQFYPQSPYAVAKLYAYWMIVVYREAYGIFASNGILFNHESPIRGETFVTRKITSGVANIVLGFKDTLYLGNLSAKRDWGHAKDYVRAMWMILQAESAEDWVVATGVSTEVRTFAKMAFAHVGIQIEFRGIGIEEKGYVVSCLQPHYQITIGQVVIAVDQTLFRPAEVDELLGDSSKVRTRLGWAPEYELQDLVAEMMESDIRLAKRRYQFSDAGEVRDGSFDKVPRLEPTKQPQFSK